MEEKLTIKQVLMMTLNQLRGIGMIPIEASEQVGVPVCGAIKNIEACIQAIEENEDAAEKEKENGDTDSE